MIAFLIAIGQLDDVAARWVPVDRINTGLLDNAAATHSALQTLPPHRRPRAAADLQPVPAPVRRPRRRRPRNCRRGRARPVEHRGPAGGVRHLGDDRGRARPRRRRREPRPRLCPGDRRGVALAGRPLHRGQLEHLGPDRRPAGLGPQRAQRVPARHALRRCGRGGPQHPDRAVPDLPGAPLARRAAAGDSGHHGPAGFGRPRRPRRTQGLRRGAGVGRGGQHPGRGEPTALGSSDPPHRTRAAGPAACREPPRAPRAGPDPDDGRVGDR